MLLLLALAAGAAGAQDTTACARAAPRALTLTPPFLPTADSVTLLTGELVANAVEGRGSLTIEYLSRAAPADTARLAREAESLARAVTPYAGSTRYALLTLRACRRVGAAAPAATFTFTQTAGGEWRAAPP